MFGLSRNHGSADKQERTVGRSKVVRKFPYGNFLPPKVRKPGRVSPVSLHLQGKCYFMRAYARFLENLLHILRNLLCGEVIVLQYLVYVIAVEKLLLEAEVQHLNVGITVKTRDLLSEAAVEYAVL